jgi:hypothetical protein
MSAITSIETRGLMEAYQAVYSPPQEITEEQVWEEVENWVNALLEEGYDLSDYTWEEMYEEWISNIVEQDATSSMADRAKRAVANQRSGFHGDDDALTRTQRTTQRSIDKLKGSAASMAKEA